MTQPEQSDIQLLPRCDVCGVEYVEDYEGPCQEPRGRYDDARGDWTDHCPGRVSWRATASMLYEDRRTTWWEGRTAPADGQETKKCRRAWEVFDR